MLTSSKKMKDAYDQITDPTLHPTFKTISIQLSYY